ncbi:hypothetical protein [Bacteroides congonensis]|uniref:hypothetical protein n=1 Tax=Bacteroides congonensis TaxID=1871006 RepID=UPI0023F8290A|nr:hypothetical protein [Bacteroides congonensis]
MGLKDITFNQAEKGKYVSGPIQVNQESVGLQLEFEKGSTLQFFISYDSENFQSVETRTCGEVFARPVIGLKKGQYIKLESTQQPIKAQYFESEE